MMFGDLLKQAEENNKKIAEELAIVSFSVNSQEDIIQVKMNGNGDLLNLDIKEALLESGNKEMLEDLILDTVNKALIQAREIQAQHSQSAMKDMLPDGFSLDQLFGS